MFECGVDAVCERGVSMDRSPRLRPRLRNASLSGRGRWGSLGIGMMPFALLAMQQPPPQQNFLIRAVLVSPVPKRLLSAASSCEISDVDALRPRPFSRPIDCRALASWPAPDAFIGRPLRLSTTSTSVTGVTGDAADSASLSVQAKLPRDERGETGLSEVEETVLTVGCRVNSSAAAAERAVWGVEVVVILSRGFCILDWVDRSRTEWRAGEAACGETKSLRINRSKTSHDDQRAFSSKIYELDMILRAEEKTKGGIEM
jgi:hypothetical protein